MAVNYDFLCIYQDSAINGKLLWWPWGDEEFSCLEILLQFPSKALFARDSHVLLHLTSNMAFTVLLQLSVVLMGCWLELAELRASVRW